MTFIGIDPGVSGGIAVIGKTGGVVAIRMPATPGDIRDVLDLEGKRLDAFAVIEHVWSTPGQGGAFKFGVSVGLLHGILTTLRIPFDPVLPRTWQKVMGITYAKGISDTEKKNITKRRAQQLFPRLTITHATADALLMAEYCRRVKRGQ